MVNGLDGYLRDHKLIQKAPLSALKDTRLGIDLEVYLRGVLSNPSTAEPVVAALGGSPLALISHIENDLRSLERARIKPVFVLSGLPPTPSPTTTNNNLKNHRNNHQQPPPNPPASATVTAQKFFSEEEWKMNERSKGWEDYSQADQDSMNLAFARSDSLEILDLVRNVLRALRHRNVEYLVAPYMASGQLVSLERHVKAYVHSMYGRDDLFMFDRVDKVILSLTLSKDNPADSFFTFASKTAIMNELRCNEEEFLDMSLLAGFEFCPPLPGLIDGALTAPVQVQPGVPPQVDIARAMGLVKQYRSGFTVCVALENHHPAMAQSGYVDLFCRARCMIKYCLVISAEEGKVMPLPLATPPPSTILGTSNGIAANGPAQGGPGSSAGTGGPNIPTAADVPVDLQDIFSLRLPDEVFLHLSRGLVGASVLRWLTSGVILEPPPFDKGETGEFRKFVKENLTEHHASPRCVAIALLRSALHPSWQSRKVSVVYWYAPQVESQVPCGSRGTQDLIQRINMWNVPVSFVEEELRRQHSSTIDIALCVGATGNATLAARTKTPKQPPSSIPKATKGVPQQNAPSSVLDKKDEVVANVIWRMLELRGFLNHDHLHTSWARALHLALVDARLNDKLQEPLFLALELLRTQVLHSNWFSNIKYEGGPALGEDPDQRKLLLVMRCFSLIPMTFKPLAWDAKVAPLSKELLVFNSFSKSLGRSLRNLVEMIASNMLLRGDARRARDDYLDIALSLPFRHDSDTGLGILVKCYIEGVISCKEGEPISPETKWDEPDLLEGKKLVLSALEDTFKNVKDVSAELKRGFRFWSALMKAVEILKKGDEISLEVVQQFEASDAWLRPMAQF